MSRYTGKKCVVCDKVFSENDDVVVCPECGTPYHRRCYDAAGRCVADGLHATGSSWRSFQVESGSILVCKRCGHENPSSAIFCEKCGMPTKMDESTQQFGSMPNQPNPQQIPQPFMFLFDEYCGLSPEEDFEGVKLKEIADFVGPNKQYFLPIFKRMKDTNKKVSINLPAALIPHYYFGYRKMYLPMIIAVISYILIEIQLQFEFLKDSSTLIYSLLSDYPKLLEQLTAFANSQLWLNLSNSLFFLGLAVSIGFAFFSNWLYYRHCINTIKKIKEKAKKQNKTVDLKKNVVKRGGTTFAGVLLVFMLLLPFIALGMAENMHALK